MNKEHKNGIVIEPSILMIDERKPGFQVLARIIQMLMIMLGSWTFCSILMECLALLAVDIHINLAIVIFSGIMFTLCFFSSYNLVKLFFGVLIYILFFISRFPRIANGFFMIENAVIDRMMSYYKYESFYYEADYSRQLPDTTLIIIMILIPVIALLTIAIMKNRFIHLSYLLLILPVVLCLLVGLVPSEPYLIVYVALTLYLARSRIPFRNIKNREQLVLLRRINTRAAAWLSILGLIIFFCLKLFITDEKYEKVTKIKDMKEKVQSIAWNYSIDDFDSWFSDLQLFGGSDASGGLDGGKLGKIEEVIYNNSDQLILTAPLESLTDGIYLKGYVGSVYTGDSWEENSKEDKAKYKDLLKELSLEEYQPINNNFLLINQLFNSQEEEVANGLIDFLSAGKEISKGNSKIEYKEANKKYIYAPYFTNYDEISGAYDVGDLYKAPKGKKSKYEFNYFLNMTNAILPYLIMDDARRNSNYAFLSVDSKEYYTESPGEELYRKYVYEVYTQLPEEGLERIKKDFAKENIPLISTWDKIFYIKELLADRTSYSLAPGKLAEDKDFVEYFYYENKKGYCAHYASAATLMLRAMGVPARYVEGYAIGSEDFMKGKHLGNDRITSYKDGVSREIETKQIQVTVKDYNAHAWVEVYLDEFGWYPIEFTPGFTDIDRESLLNNNNNGTNPQLGLTNPIPTVKPQDRDTEAEDREDKEEKVTEEKKEKAGTTANKGDSDKRAVGRGVTKEEEAKLNHIFLIIFILLMIGAISAFILVKNRRRSCQNNRNKRALFLFMEVERILSLCRNGLPSRGARLEDCEEYIKENNPYIEAEVFEVCMEVVRKARFGYGRITSQELMKVKVFRDNLYSKVYQGLPMIKKLYLKYILLMGI